ncbi:unnamed protein product [Symbiodinium natans]|uniref:Uncharacterized protein n=1 Tax=Symbiodinium natans TaxID=878477 RepID=A0A812SRY3_9DINO|nr:unnamed protein product [Symbiodinium natans]
MAKAKHGASTRTSPTLHICAMAWCGILRDQLPVSNGSSIYVGGYIRTSSTQSGADTMLDHTSHLTTWLTTAARTMTPTRALKSRLRLSVR